jgi:hypothetical protein
VPELNVVKADGQIVPFDIEKVRRSLRRARVDPDAIEMIADRVAGKIYDRIATSELYSIVFGELKTLQKGSAGKYNLKKAIFQMGPTGFPFEKLIGALFETEGFTTSTGQIVKGRCVSHEVDVVAEKGDLHYDAECKFHSFQGKVCDVKHALYVHARFVDIGKELESRALNADRTHRGWLVTNTRMTSEAIAYGTCVGLGLLSWDYPPEKSLRERIDGSGLHPVTCLTTLSVKLKRQLLEKGIITCRDLIAGPQVLLEFGLSQPEIDEAIDEAYAICESSNLQA